MTFEEAGNPFIYLVFTCLFLKERERAGEGQSRVGAGVTEDPEQAPR